MGTTQFNKEKSDHIWFSLTYQSNNLLNEETHNTIKALIGEELLKTELVKDIHSYIHGNIVFAVNSANAETTFDTLVGILEKPMASQSPRLLFNLSIVGISTTQNGVWKCFMHIEGKDDLDTNFRQSIGL